MHHPSIAAAQVLAELQRHVGRSQGVSVRRLVQLVSNLDQVLPAQERFVRGHISTLRLAGHPICGRPDCGYFFAATAEELEETCAYLHGRAMSSLHLASAMRRHALPALAGQASLSTHQPTA